MNMNPGAKEIIEAARSNPYDRAAVAKLVVKYEPIVVAEALCWLAMVIPQGSNVSYRSR
jgi:hypothetical protein